MSSKFEFIDGEKANYKITKMCAWLKVSRSGFYEWRDRPASATAGRRAYLAGLIKAIHDEFEQRYGTLDNAQFVELLQERADDVVELGHSGF